MTLTGDIISSSSAAVKVQDQHFFVRASISSYDSLQITRFLSHCSENRHNTLFTFVHLCTMPLIIVLTSEFSIAKFTFKNIT